MKANLWFSFRLAIIAWFFASGFAMANDIPPVPPSGFWAVPITASAGFAAWRFYSILAAQWRQKKQGQDWSASLWFSPILRNPQSFPVMGGAAIAAGGCGIVAAGRTALPGLFFLSFGIGILVGVLIFRIKNA